MILLETLKNGNELNLNSSSATFTGYGHYKVEVELEYMGEYKTFTKTTTDMEAIDEAKELGIESWEDKTKRLYDCIEYAISENVQEWMQDVDFENEKVYD